MYSLVLYRSACPWLLLPRQQLGHHLILWILFSLALTVPDLTPFQFSYRYLFRAIYLYCSNAEHGLRYLDATR
jgi:hypothetical protein